MNNMGVMLLLGGGCGGVEEQDVPRGLALLHRTASLGLDSARNNMLVCAVMWRHLPIGRDDVAGERFRSVFDALGLGGDENQGIFHSETMVRMANRFRSCAEPTSDSYHAATYNAAFAFEYAYNTGMTPFAEIKSAWQHVANQLSGFPAGDFALAVLRMRRGLKADGDDHRGYTQLLQEATSAEYSPAYVVLADASKPDNVLALSWLVPAALQNWPSAEYEVGRLLLAQGACGRREAVIWFMRAFDHGLMQHATYFLRSLSVDGHIIPTERALWIDEIPDLQ